MSAAAITFATLAALLLVALIFLLGINARLCDRQDKILNHQASLFEFQGKIADAVKGLLDANEEIVYQNDALANAFRDLAAKQLKPRGLDIKFHPDAMRPAGPAGGEGPTPGPESTTTSNH
jgi:HAMP domain-containing protein